MAGPILFVDFDRTLFDTDRFVEVLWLVLSKAFGLASETLKSTQSDFFEYVDQQYDYDFFAHLHALTGEPHDTIRSRVKGDLVGMNFLFDDSGELRSWQGWGYDVRILTFGNEPYQRLKLDLAPDLKDVPIDIIQEPKRDFIARNYKGGRGWLIDDKIGQEIPKGFMEINIDRTALLPSRVQNGYGIVNNLKHVQDLL
jgi:hypothetical protein